MSAAAFCPPASALGDWHAPLRILGGVATCRIPPGANSFTFPADLETVYPRTAPPVAQLRVAGLSQTIAETHAQLGVTR